MLQAVGLGAGAHAKVVIDALLMRSDMKIIGLLDPDRALWGTAVCGVPVLGGDDLLEGLRDTGARAAFVSVGSIAYSPIRKALYERALAAGFELISAIHPRAVVSPLATIGAGVAIMAGAVVNAGAVVGDNVIINTGAIVEHDCQIGSHAHVATGARVGGAVSVGESAHIGIGASVRQGIRVGLRAVVGAGAVVVSDVADNAVVIGVPARPMAVERA